MLHVRSLRGGVSGGTIDSLRQQLIESDQDPEARRLAGDERALVDEVSGQRYGSSGDGRGGGRSAGTTPAPGRRRS